MTPSEVWAGNVSHAEYSLFHEAEKLVLVLAPTAKYDDPLVDYNNDPATTFANVQSFFVQLEAMVTKNARSRSCARSLRPAQRTRTTHTG